MPDFLVERLWIELRIETTFTPPSEVISSHDGRPYLNRWHITPKGDAPACYLQQFLASDDDRAMHDHPYASIGIILSGEYIEHIQGSDGEVTTTHRRPGDVIHRDALHTHRVELLRAADGTEREAWTLFLVGPRERGWGFACHPWMPQELFHTSGPDGRSLGCDAGRESAR